MKLDTYMRETGTTATALAGVIGCNVSTITRIAKGEVTPSPHNAVAIVKATEGRVSLEDLYGVPPMGAAE
jgi:DNA-binding transcriptional regulator YdaS (Cro superfamily)